MASTTLYKTSYASDATHLAICNFWRWFQWWKPQVSILFENELIRKILSQQKPGFFLHFPAEIAFLKSLAWVEAAS